MLLGYALWFSAVLFNPSGMQANCSDCVCDYISDVIVQHLRATRREFSITDRWIGRHGDFKQTWNQSTSDLFVSVRTIVKRAHQWFLCKTDPSINDLSPIELWKEIIHLHFYYYCFLSHEVERIMKCSRSYPVYAVFFTHILLGTLSYYVSIQRDLVHT